MERVRVKSTNIESVGYDAHSRILEIEFHGGRIYRYLEVPVQVYNGLMASGSKGKFLNMEIRDKYKTE